MQKVVRTSPNNWSGKTTALQDLLDQGYKVVMCHETILEGATKCLEYIVEKEDIESQ